MLTYSQLRKAEKKSTCEPRCEKRTFEGVPCSSNNTRTHTHKTVFKFFFARVPYVSLSFILSSEH